MTRSCGNGLCGDCPQCDIEWATLPEHDEEPADEDEGRERTPEEQAAWLARWAELDAV